MRLGNVFSAIGILLLVYVSAGVAMDVEDEPIILLSPTVLHVGAISATLPEYPRVSLSAKHSGVVVTDVIVSRRGVVEKVQILDSPDQDISNAVVSAIQQWRFHPFITSAGSPASVRSRLIFYFTISGTKHRVVDAIAEPLPNSRGK